MSVSADAHGSVAVATMQLTRFRMNPRAFSAGFHGRSDHDGGCRALGRAPRAGDHVDKPGVTRRYRAAVGAGRDSPRACCFRRMARRIACQRIQFMSVRVLLWIPEAFHARKRQTFQDALVWAASADRHRKYVVVLFWDLSSIKPKG